jgi:hypothetical protein
VLGGTKKGRSVVRSTVGSIANRKNGPRWERLHPELRAKVEELERRAQVSGLDVMFWDGWRSPEASAANIAAGASKVKNPLDSLHVWGLAADIVFRNALGVAYWPEDTDPRWRQLAAIGEALGLKSGGLMWGWDWPHFQLPGYTSAALRASWGASYLDFIGSTGAIVT